MEDRCVVCGGVVPEGRHVCPICNREYDDWPALSREDNLTLICPECGAREAVRAAGKYNGMSDEEIKRTEEQVIAEIRKVTGRKNAGGVEVG